MIEKLRSGLAGRYDVLRKIGEGGMATVFLANDLKHNRQVAIKVLQPDVAASIGPKRFVQEIGIAARLQHPHVLPVYDSGESAGVLYYVMPFVEGESLRELLAREGKLAWRTARDIAREVASALDYAHRQGVVHRDIKPANILISQGHAVVADFGIARALSASGGAGMTQAGMAIGTPWYMSPEQTMGDPNIDGRTDIYALGCVLFEMVTGKPPYDGPTPQSIVAKTMSAPVPKLERVADLPGSIPTIVSRSLAKEPVERFASAAEFAEALEASTGEMPAWNRGRRWTVPVLASTVAVLLATLVFFRTGGSSSSVVEGADILAVLPFSATGANVEYLEEGMVDLLSANLNEVGGIRAVDSRLVLNKWKNEGGADGLDLDGSMRVARAVDASSVLVGTVVEAGNRVRFTAEWHDLEGNEVARETLDGPAENILELVDSLSLRLLRQAWRSNEPVPSMSVAGVTTGSLAAIRAYLRGAQYYRAGVWDSAVTAFSEAVEIDSTFALAHASLAMSQGWITGLGGPGTNTAVERAMQFADRLPARDRSLITAYHLFLAQDITSLDTLQSYVQRYPSDPVGWHLLGDVQYHAQSVLGLGFNERLAPFDRAIALDSTFSPAAVHPAELSAMAGDQERFASYRALMPQNVRQQEQHQMLEGLLLGSGADHDELLRQLSASPANFASALAVFAYLDRDARDQVIVLLDSMLTQADLQMGVRIQGLIGLATISMAAGQVDRGLATVDRLTQLNIPGLDNLASIYYVQAALLGLIEQEDAADKLEQFRAAAGDVGFPLILDAQAALVAGNATSAREILQGPGLDTVITNQGFEIRLPALKRATLGWATLVEGDTALGIAELKGGIQDFGLIFTGVQSGTGIMRLTLASAMANYEPMREEGIAWLQHGFAADLELLPFAHHARGEALASAGLNEEAALAFNDFVELWQDADPDLQERVATVRQRIAQLTAEGPPTPN